MKKYSTSCISSHTAIRYKEISLLSVSNMSQTKKLGYFFTFLGS